MSFFRTGRPEWIMDLEPDKVFYDNLWDGRTIQIEMESKFGSNRIHTRTINSLNTKLNEIFTDKLWYSKTYIDIGFEVKPAFQMKRFHMAWDDGVSKTSPHVLIYNPTLEELNENLIKNIGHYLVPTMLLVKNPTRYGFDKSQTEELFGLLKSDYTLVKYADEKINNLINWRITNPFEVLK